MGEPALTLFILHSSIHNTTAPFFEQLSLTLSSRGIAYEIIIVHQGTEAHIKEKLQPFIDTHHISFQELPYNPSDEMYKKIFSRAKYPYLCILNEELSPALSLLPKMFEKMQKGADMVIADEAEDDVPKDMFRSFFISFLHKLPFNINSNILMMKKEIAERIALDVTSPASRLTFFIKTRDANYKIAREKHDAHVYHFSKKPFYSFSMALTALQLKLARPEIIPFHPETVKQKGKGFHYKGQEFVHHSSLHHGQTAFHRLSGIQMVLFIALIPILAEGLLFDWHTTIVIFLAAITLIYFADLLFNLFLIYRSFSRPSEIEITKKELQEANTREWPAYTVFCPLYKEWQVLPQFVSAISKLEYPKDKLQVMLLLEEDDKETINHIKQYSLPDYFEIRIVPDSHPKTKPKACNYGLQFATGEYTVIYDAEDVPDPLQLKKIVIAFQKANKKTVCIQAKLNFYNPHQNLLTRVFTAEYSLWFDLVLTGLHSIKAPIPLGGTSNHFRTQDLHLLKGWDSFNVTEDCDLGMRLVKRGFKTAIVDSTTLEEANSGMKNWFWQRTRWIKGYMQTYLLHMRNPRDFIQNWREPHVITFQLVVGGKVMSMFINPLMWITTILYFAYRAHVGTFIESFFPLPVLYMGVLSLLLGNFLYMYYYMIGCAKHGHDELVKYVFLVPIYWLAMSLAAYVALYKLITAPHYWSKTKHGLHLNNKKAVSHAATILGHTLVDEQHMKGGYNIAPAHFITK